MKTYAINKNIKLKKNNNFSYEINKKKKQFKMLKYLALFSFV